MTVARPRYLSGSASDIARRKAQSVSSQVEVAEEGIVKIVENNSQFEKLIECHYFALSELENWAFGWLHLLPWNCCSMLLHEHMLCTERNSNNCITLKFTSWQLIQWISSHSVLLSMMFRSVCACMSVQLNRNCGIVSSSQTSSFMVPSSNWFREHKIGLNNYLQ